jgi:hypothetical protein
MPDSEPFVEPVAQVGKWVFGKVVGEGKPEESSSRAPFTDITIILDRSGSMGAIREAAVKGVNDYMRSVDEEPGDGCWSLVQFDDWDSARGAKESFPQKVFEQVPTEQRPFLESHSYQPRGSTALVDAVALTIQQIKARIAALAEEKRPTRVMVVIMTDGLENASKEYNNATLRAMIAEQQAAGWGFLYLGANQDSFAEAGKYGIDRKFARNYAAMDEGVGSVLASAARFSRAWKLDGNQSAARFQTDGEPDGSVSEPPEAKAEP